MMRTPLSLFLCLVAGSAFGAGCGGSDGPPLEREPVVIEDTGPRRATDCGADAGLEFFVVDDFERGAATTAFTNNEFCEGCPSLEGEPQLICVEECRASQSPTDYDKPLPAELVPGGRCESRYALHVTTAHFYQWGGLVGFPFAPAVDAREYDGISFWARIAWGTRAELRGSALDPGTDATFVDPETGEPLCDPESNLDDFHGACDPYTRAVTATGDWRFFMIPFEELRQRGFGQRTPYLDLGAIRQISIEYGFGAWDFWIDDIALYRHREDAQ